MATQQPRAHAAAKVLVVDDEPDIRHIAGLALTRLGGMEVVEAANADEGIAAAEQEHPDIILLDCMMPGKDGLAALAALRDNPATASIPVVFLTARSGFADEATLRRLGARGLLMKPFDPTTLPEKVRELLSRDRERNGPIRK
jgi:CheY-like chemotaxis protein